MIRVCSILVALLTAGPRPGHGSEIDQHARVAQRRQGLVIICHRGASEFAHENTLEAYRAALELGADGSEIDIRATRDGALVCFHDDMLDHLLEAFGDVADYDWAELQTFAFRRPGPFAAFCRIPTLEEVFALHRKHAGLMHLDVKRPGLEPAIVELLNRLDLWDHVVAVNAETAPALLKHPRYRPLRYKGSLYPDRAEVNPAAIAAMLGKQGDMVIADDPRGVLAALGRRITRPSSQPVTTIQRPAPPRPPERTEHELSAVLLNDADWDALPQTPAERTAKAQAILRRANAAEEIRRRKLSSAAIEAALVRRVRRRSLHPEWLHHGLDAATALRALAELRSPQLPALARDSLWRDDPEVAAVLDPMFKVPRSWTDFRLKNIAFELVERLPGTASERLCHDYLLLSDDEARRIGQPQFEQAARTLLALRPDRATAVELLRHRRSDVRGAVILTCLNKIESPWAKSALQAAAPHALAYVLAD